MAQRQKDEIRKRLLSAALEVFSEVGFAAATVAEVAARAQVSTGNVYRYFASKEVLLREALPATFVSELKAMTRARVDALGAARDIARLPADAEYFSAADQLFEFCVEHRQEVVFLLSGSKGTEYEGFAEELAGDLEGWAMAYARRAWPKLRASRALRFTLREVYRNYVGAIARALAEHAERAALEDAIAHLSAYHLGGMKQLFETAQRSVAERRRRPIGGTA